jgi:tetratricopeptide (TPR) repeat protein
MTNAPLTTRPGNAGIPPSLRPPDLLQWPIPWVCALILGLTLAAYFPALMGGFIWDDAGHVTRPELRPLSGLVRIWTEVGATQQYYPLLHTAFWVEHRLWGDAAWAYHLLNVLLHAAGACLFGLALRRLAIPGAWLAALLFALHPAGVESVAWITEQKNTLSTLFYLAAFLAYLRFDETRRSRPYALATGFFLMALLTKSVTATLPAALLVILWWQRGRLTWRRDGQPLLPWFALSLAAGWITASVERTHIGAQGADFALSVVDRCLVAGRAIWFYLGTLLWPADLVFIYPRWIVDSSQAWQYLFPLGAVGLLAVLVWQRRRARGALAAFLFYVGTLFPALGFINVYPFIYSFVADHFQYLASLGVFALAAAFLMKGFARLPRWVGSTAALAFLAALGSLTWAQSGTYRDLFTLYETTIARNPDCWMAHNNLAMALADAGRLPEAIPHLETALRLRPGFAEAESNLGDDLTRSGRAAEAIPHLERALQLQPGYAEASNNLGAALMALGRPAEGLAKFAEAVRLKPDYAVAHFNLGLALASSGRAAEAIPHFAAAVRLQPDYAEAQLDWGIGLSLSGRFPESVPHFEEALRLQPGSAETHHLYGRALAAAGQLDDAIHHYEQALQLNPNFAEAHLSLATALRQAGRMQEANAHYLEAVRLGATASSPAGK